MENSARLANGITTAISARASRLWLAVALLVVSTVICGISWYIRQPDVWYRRGLDALIRGDVKSIQESARRLQRRARGSARADLLQGAAALRTGDPAGALAFLKRAGADPETEWQARFLAGEALYRLQEYEAAVATLQAAVDHSPDNVDGHRWLAAACFDLGDIDQAIAHLIRVAELAPDDPRPHRMMGVIYADAEDYKQAVDAYQASLQRSRRHAGLDEVLAELAAVQIKLRRYTDALETLASDHETVDLRILRAEALYGLGQTDDARQILEATSTADSDPRALVLRGLMLLDSGRPKQAATLLRQGVALQPDDFETRFKYVQALAQSGEAERARLEFAEVDRIKRIRLEFAGLLAQAQKFPHDADIRFQLGELSAQLMRPELARKWYRAALALDPGHTRARAAINANGP